MDSDSDSDTCGSDAFFAAATNPDTEYLCAIAPILDGWIGRAEGAGGSSASIYARRRQLADKALALKGNDHERAIELLSYADEHRQYFEGIGYDGASDDDLLHLANTPTRSRPLHALSLLPWHDFRALLRPLVDGERSVCEQELLVAAVCGDDPDCFEEMLGFEAGGNLSLVRLSRKLLRFLCRQVNRGISQHVDETLHILDLNLANGWWAQHLQTRKRPGVTFRIRFPDRSDVEVPVTLQACVEHVQRVLNARTPPWNHVTRDVFRAFAKRTLVAAVLAHRRAFEEALLHRRHRASGPVILIDDL